MDAMTLALLATGLGVGMVSGMLGIGGAAVLVPALMFGFGFSQALYVVGMGSTGNPPRLHTTGGPR
jgi:uncharacterized membrane protein YfcA